MEHIPLHRCCELCDWLVCKGLTMYECAHIITDMEVGDSFGLALLKSFKRREVDKQNEKNTFFNAPNCS